ncbi:MAG: branched-chain amino acid ABC transporter substrate-binding protein [Nitrospirota bacterium]|nr:branched-chain amino acid ABC transporter substrate-binding protein [Nitrospirota bacterium]
MKKLLLAAGAVALSGVLLAGCGKSEKGAAGDLIKIGVAGPMTGDQSKMGIDFKNGVELAVEEWNQKGGVLGKKIATVVGDDQHDPKQAVAVANKLVNDGVVGVIGHFNSSCSIPASSVYQQTGIPMITPASTNPQLTEQGFQNIFRVCGRDDQQGRIAADFVVNRLGKKRIAILHDKTTYGQGLSEELKKALGDSIEVVAYEGVTQGDKDFKAVLSAIKTKKPEALYFGGVYPEAGLMVKQARELGIDAVFISGDGTIDTKFIEIAGAAAEGAYLTFSPDPNGIPTAKAFLESYHKKYGEHGPYSIYAYDAANILLNAIQKAGATDGKKVAELIRATPHDGALGKVQFDAKGDVTVAPYVIWVTKGGKFEEMK